MSKSHIKVIKKNKPPVSENNLPEDTESANIQTAAQRHMVSVVKGWIDGRIASRRTEELAASGDLVTWKIIKDDLQETQ